MNPPPVLPESAWTVLAHLEHIGIHTYTEIAGATGLTVATVGHQVRTLVDHGWATTTRGDGRTLVVHITPDGRSENREQANRPTVGAVIAEARRLCRAAATEMAADPYARPYAPSDDVARKLSQQYGPERAVEILRERAADRKRRAREQDEIADRAQKRHERHQRRNHRDTQARLAGLTLGARLDAALAGFSTLQSVPAARLNDSPVTDGGGGKDNANPVPRLYDDTADKARRKARQLVAELEDLLERDRRRLCDFERTAA